MRYFTLVTILLAINAGVAGAQVDVGNARVVYDPLTGGFSFENLANVGGIAFRDLGDLGMNKSAASDVGGLIDVSIDDEVAWLFLDPLNGSGFSTGYIAAAGLSADLSKYSFGVVLAGSGIPTPTPIPIYSPSGIYIPESNPWVRPDPTPDPTPDLTPDLTPVPAPNNGFFEDAPTGEVFIEDLTSLHEIPIREPNLYLNPAPEVFDVLVDQRLENELMWLFYTSEDYMAVALDQFETAGLSRTIFRQNSTGIVTTCSDGVEATLQNFKSLIPEPSAAALASISAIGLIVASRRSSVATPPVRP